MEGPSPELVLVKDRPTYFLQTTVFNPAIAQQLAPPLEIAQTPQAIEQRERTITQVKEQTKGFFPKEVESVLSAMLNGFATERPGWNTQTINASLEVLKVIGLSKLSSVQINTAYSRAVEEILPSHFETHAEIGIKGLIEAGIVFYLGPHRQKYHPVSARTINVLKEELEKKLNFGTISQESYSSLSKRLDNLYYAVKTGLPEPIEIKPKDTTELARKFQEFVQHLTTRKWNSQTKSDLDTLVLEAINYYGLSQPDIIDISGLNKERIWSSIRSLKDQKLITRSNVHNQQFYMQIEELLKSKPNLTTQQIANVLGEGITVKMVESYKAKLKEQARIKPVTAEENLDQTILDLRNQELSHREISAQTGLPINKVKYHIRKMLKEGKVARKRFGTNLTKSNNPIIQRAIHFDANVGYILSANPEMLQKDIAQKLKSSPSTVQNSIMRLNRLKSLEQLLERTNDIKQIANAMGVSEEKAEFEIERLKKIRSLQQAWETAARN